MTHRYLTRRPHRPHHRRLRPDGEHGASDAFDRGGAAGLGGGDGTLESLGHGASTDCHCRKSEGRRSVGRSAICCWESMGPAVGSIEVLCNKGAFDVGFAGEVLPMVPALSDNSRSDDEKLLRGVGGQPYDLPMCNEACNRYSRLSNLN